MNKNDLVLAVKEAANFETKADAERAFNAVVKVLAAAVAKEESLAVPGLGSFKTVSRAARCGRNPRTGESLEIPASKSVKFQACKEIRDAVNK